MDEDHGQTTMDKQPWTANYVHIVHGVRPWLFVHGCLSMAVRPLCSSMAVRPLCFVCVKGQSPSKM